MEDILFSNEMMREYYGIKMPKIRVRSSKPGTKGSYNQGRDVQKARNHTHIFKQYQNTRGKTVEYCTISRCKELHIK